MQEYTEHFVRDHGAARARDRPKPKPIDRPTVGMSCSPADYNDFVRRWNQYKKDTGLPSDQVNGQLVGCLSAELESNFASANFDVSTMTEADILAEMKTFAVAQVAINTEARAQRSEDGTDPARCWSDCGTTPISSSWMAAGACHDKRVSTFDLSSPPTRMTTEQARWTADGLCPARISDETVVSATAGEWRRAIGDILRFSQQSAGAVTAVSQVRDQATPEEVLVRHHFRLRNPSTTSLTPTAAFRQLVESSLAEDTDTPPQDAPRDTSTYTTPPTTPAAGRRETPLQRREYVALVCPVTARPRGDGAAHVEGTVISPEQEMQEREAAETSAEAATSDLSDLSETECVVEPAIRHVPGVEESDLREPAGMSCQYRGGARE